tara:strand:+ start:9603 stop:10277 length:675 start_codon:yes stop_codon:yes gene_type:complete
MNKENTYLKSYPEKSIFGFINGNAGQIETVINTAKDQNNSEYIAIICHPHPLHGGTMHNKVVHTASKSFNELGFDTIRFNYRGVGKSTGEFGNSIGESDDLQSVIHWLKKYKPNTKLILAGFSFGSFIALSCAQNTENNCHALISIAPAVNHQDYNQYMPMDKNLPWLLIHGTKDEIIDLNIVTNWIDTLSIKPEVQLFTDATHFFHGYLIDLKKTIINFMRHS